MTKRLRDDDEQYDYNLELEVFQFLDDIQHRHKKQNQFLEDIKQALPEDNAIYCDDDIDTLGDYVADVEDYIGFATIEDKEEFLRYVEEKN